jgi:hypothetical protein
MARIRTVKPEFFRHEALQDLEAANPGAYTMLVFAGLWGHCDKHGVFEYRPRTLKLDILPFLPFDMATTLDLLVSHGFVERVEVDGKCYGRIPSFTEHQRITGKEAQEPARHELPCEASGQQQGNNWEAPETTGREGKGIGREGEKEGSALAKALATPSLDSAAFTRWEAYRREIGKSLKPTSLMAAAEAMAKFGPNQDAVVQQSIANGWQGLFPLKNSGAAGDSRQVASRRRILTADEIEAKERASANG